MFDVHFLSQILVLIAYIICGIAFLQKKQLKIMMLVSVFNMLILIQYALLGAIMGIIANVINIIRNIIFIFNLKYKKRNSIWLLVFFSLSTIILTIVFYSSYLDIFPCILAIVGTFSYWINNTRILRLCNILCSICYIMYALPLNSYITIIAEFYLIITTIIGYIKHEKSLKQTT